MVSWLLSSNRSSHTNQCPSLQLQLQFHLTPPNPLLQRLCCSPSLCLLAGLPQAQWLSSLFSPSGQWAQPSGAQRGCLCGDSQRFKSPSHRVYYTFFFLNLFFMWRGGRKVMLFIWAIKIDSTQQAVKVSFQQSVLPPLEGNFLLMY